MTTALQADGLGKRYRRRWALRDCNLAIPEGRFVGLVGPSGAGKTTLLHLAVGLLAPTAGTIRVFGGRPGRGRAQLGRSGFVAQDTPLYPRLSVAQHVRLGGWLNRNWDRELAARRIERLGLGLRDRAGWLSAGQRAQLALTLAIAKRPELLVLDEPLAGLDPLERREFVHGLLAAVERGASVVLSSDSVADLERICDYLVVLAGSRVQLAGEVSVLLASHHRLSGPRRDPGARPAGQEIIEEAHADEQTRLLVRSDEPISDPAWAVTPIGLDELVHAYLSRTGDAGGARRPGLGAET
jgi:ABC-2 type transport system ATP-binding protein